MEEIFFSGVVERVLFIQNNCPHCKKYLGIVDEVNSKIKDKNKRIDTVFIDGFDSRIPRYRSLLRMGVPQINIDGYVIVGATNEAFVRGFLYGYFRKMGDFDA